MIIRSAKYLLFLLPLVFSANAMAQTSIEDVKKIKIATTPQPADDPWKFKDRYHHFAFETGFAKEVKLNAAQNSNVEMFFFRPQYVIRLYDPPKSPVYRFDLVNEATFVLAVRPHVAGVYGWNEILRMNFRPLGKSKRTIVYWDNGAGINRFNLKVPSELTGRFQFSLQTGVGFKYRPSRKRLAYGCGLSAYHFSDNGIRKPNQGVNLLRLSCGVDLLPRE